MNRGYEGRPLFKDDLDRKFFLDLIKNQSKKLRIRIFAYCLMDNHYHLVLENTSGRMSDFFKQINGQYGSHFRRKYKGRGYLYQDRFKSMLIQDDSYLKIAIGYALNNPVRAKLVRSFLDFNWSSANLYFKEGESEMVDHGFVENLFDSKNNLITFIESLSITELPTINTRMGKIIGGDEFKAKAIRKFDRRTTPEHTLESKRIDDLQFMPVEQIYQEFQRMKGFKIEELDTYTIQGKRIRAELLIHLKDNTGLTYSEIVKYPGFSDVKVSSLGAIYRDAKIRMGKR